MRIAISGAAGIAALLIAASAAAQGDKPQPLPVMPVIPGAVPAQPAVSSAAPSASASAQPAAAPQAPPATPAKGNEHPDAPPAPPPPGLAPPPPAPVQAPVFASDSPSGVAKEAPLAGWHGSFFLRDPGDYFRLYPRGRLNLDFNSWPGAPTGEAKDGGVALQPRFYIRRLRLELAGQFLTNWSFHVAADFGGQPVSNSNGKAQQSASSAGADPTAATARFAAVEVASAAAVPVDVFLNYSVCSCLNFMAGQYDIAFSMENQTSDNNTSFTERSLGINFAVPSKKEIGLTVWGELFDGRLAYAAEVLAGDGQNRPQVDANPDFAARIFTRPLFGGKGPLEKLQIGISARTGERDPRFVGYDYPSISTTQGYALWTPTYKDSLGRTVHVIPSGSQNAIGGELRIPVSIFELHGEAYYVANNTREAIDGYQLTNTERLGQMSGVGWYVQASAWPLGDSFINGDPGFLRPTNVDLNKPMGKPKRGLEVAARISGVSADYQGSSRGGTADAKTATKETGSAINLFEYGFAVNYWYTRNLRLGLDYSIYHAPGSGTPTENRALVPANLGATPNNDEHLLHELGARAAVWF